MKHAMSFKSLSLLRSTFAASATPMAANAARRIRPSTLIACRAQPATAATAVRALATGAAAAMNTSSSTPFIDQTSAITFEKKAANPAPLDPALHIDKFQFSPETRNSLRHTYGITTLYPIQGRVFEPVAEGADLVARSRTGTGKTLAFVLPLVERMLKEGTRPVKRQTQVLILEPTRELARQVAQEIEKLDPRFSVASVYGGAAFGPQVGAISSGVHFLVGTPGRIKDHIERGTLDLSAVMSVVLDEADEMLRMGFQEAVEEILSFVKSNKQMLLFSATMPKWVEQVSRRHLKNPINIDVVGDSVEKTPDTISHCALVAPDSNLSSRGKLIAHLLAQLLPKGGRVLLFAETKRDCDALRGDPAIQKFGRTEAIHGDVSQASREDALEKFKSGQVQVLIATDVAARGLDIPSVELVVLAGPPRDVETYIHRSGRTGRAGKSGRCVIVHTRDQRPFINSLSHEIGAPIRPIHLSASDDAKRVAAKAGDLIRQTSSALTQRVRPHVEEWLRKSNNLGGANGDAKREITVDMALSYASSLVASLGALGQTERSLLCSAPGFVTVLMKDSRIRSANAASDVLRTVLGREPGLAGGQEPFSGGYLIDVSLVDAEAIRAKLAAEPALTKSIEIPTELPASIYSTLTSGLTFAHSDVSGRQQGRNGGSRSRPRYGGNNGYGGGNGGYSSGGYRGGSDSGSGRSRYGGDDRGGYRSGGSSGSYSGGGGGSYSRARYFSTTALMQPTHSLLL